MSNWKKFSKETREFRPNVVSNNRKIQVFGSSERKWAKIEHDIEKILTIIKDSSFFQNTGFKNLPNIEITFQKVTQDGTFFFQSSENILISESKEIVLFKKQKNSYVELIFELISIDHRVLACRPRIARTAEDTRKFNRIPVQNREVFAKSFRVAKIDEDIFYYLPKDESSLLEIQKDYQITHPNISLKYLYKKEKLSLEEFIVAEEGKPIFIRDASSVQSHPGNFVDLEKVYLEEGILEEKKDEFSLAGLSSFLYYPIYFRLMGKEIFVGVGYLEAYNARSIPTSDLFLMEEIETRFTRSILDNFNQTFEEEHSVLNFSEGGVLFQARNVNLAEAILARPHFSAVICIGDESMELTFEARNIYKIEDNFYIGSELSGSIHSNPNIQKYLQLLKKRN